jgi:hypothetical protein
MQLGGAAGELPLQGCQISRYIPFLFAVKWLYSLTRSSQLELATANRADSSRGDFFWEVLIFWGGYGKLNLESKYR